MMSKDKFQFTHPVWGATQGRNALHQRQRVSIHAPRVGCDYKDEGEVFPQKRFNSRTPCGVRQNRVAKSDWLLRVSIHAPRVGCDATLQGVCFSFEIVSIHAPRVGCDSVGYLAFRITLVVSIHAPRVGCDVVGATYCSGTPCFNSRTPCGVRHRDDQSRAVRNTFQFTHPVWGATTLLERLERLVSCFNSRTPCGVRLSLITSLLKRQ